MTEVTNAAVVVEAQAEKPAIKNLSTMSNAHLAKVLTDNGIPVPEHPTRSQLVSLARENNLWTFKGNIVAKDFKKKYAALGGNCGDLIAEAFKGTEEADWQEFAKANSVDYSRWSHLNVGQRRMNLSNVLRGMIKRGESVVIGFYEWDAGELIGQPEADASEPEVETPEAEPVAEVEETPVEPTDEPVPEGWDFVGGPVDTDLTE